MLPFRSSWCVMNVFRKRQALATLCTVTLNKQPKLPEHFRTLENDPSKHSLDHVGKFYTVDGKSVDKISKLGGLPEVFVQQTRACNETCLMVREPAVELLHYLKTANYSLPAIRYVLYSTNEGAGLTLTLAHTLHYACLQNWVIVHFPNAYGWIKWTWRKNVKENTFNSKLIDQNEEAVPWLQHFKNQNKQFLDQIRLSKEYQWSKSKASQKGDSLASVVELALSSEEHASDCLAVILKEIKQQTGPNTFRTIVVIDGVNSLFGPVRLYRDDQTLVTLDELTCIRAFKKLLQNDWSNAAIVVSVDPASEFKLQTPVERPRKILYPARNNHVLEKPDPNAPVVRERRKRYPKELLGPSGFRTMSPFVPIEVPIYSSKELQSCLDYYLDRRLIQGEAGRSDEGREELIFLSGGIPRDLMRFCLPI